MSTTLSDEDHLIVHKFLVGTDDLERGDIVVFEAPDGSGKDYIKRVIALPHEFVQIEGGRVYVNGDRLVEPYINTEYTHTEEDSEWLVGEDEFFVLGDNRLEGRSKDSRSFGPVDGDLLVGKAVFRFLPLSSIGGL